ncbi:MAG: hypothetical protein FJ213_00660 [Ignavibacteria bacterium]|nr:hypothetical protein [Ignavibacteria bacterium]
MSTTTVRISNKAYRILKDIKKRTGDSFQTIIEESLDSYKEKEFWDEVDSAFKYLKATSVWNEELKERKIWDTALSDGIKD